VVWWQRCGWLRVEKGKLGKKGENGGIERGAEQGYSRVIEG